MSTSPRRLVSAERREEDAAEASLRPQLLAEFIGQEQARSNLRVFIEAAKSRGQALDHVLLVGPPGLGKTTLAQIVTHELSVNFRSTSGPVIAKLPLLAMSISFQQAIMLTMDTIIFTGMKMELIIHAASRRKKRIGLM